MSTLYNFILNPASYLIVQYIQDAYITAIIMYGTTSTIFLFYPIAGYLADNKYGQHKAVVFSLWLLLFLYIFFTIFLSLVTMVLVGLLNITVLVLALFLLLISVSLLFISIGSFDANIIQFGVDQLYEFPVEDQSLFIHWSIWVTNLTTFFSQLMNTSIENPYAVFNQIVLSNITMTNNNIGYSGIGAYILFCIILFVLLVVSLYIAHCRKNWFLIEPSRVNPYKLVYKVIKFAWQHKVPVNRSAFTYCEDDTPSGLNLAKDKYGGPFTTEQVEDVKVFCEIIKVLFSLGPVLSLHFAADIMLDEYIKHGSIFEISHSNFSNLTYYNNEPVKLLLINAGVLKYLIAIICIPLYLFLLLPFLLNYIPGMLKRIGIGATMTILSLICTVASGAWSHTRYKVGCMFDRDSAIVILNDTLGTLSDAGPFYDTSLVTIQYILLSLSSMLIYIALYEFICSQSPHSMKGLFIGLLYAIRGLFYAFAAALSLPFALAMDNTHISCGVFYYVMNTGVGVVAVLVYVWVSRKYKYRERDEPSNIYMYAENYYSKGPPEE